MSLVSLGGALRTAHHRTAAAVRTGTPVPAVDGDDLLKAAGVDVIPFRLRVAEAYGIDL